MKTLKFSVNNWNHLYSLEQAVLKDQQITGKYLTISGLVNELDLLENKSTPVLITFNQVDDIYEYNKTKSGQIILGHIKRLNDKLESTLPVNGNVFEELRKNLMEYSDIDGIHIVVSIGLDSEPHDWPVNTEYSILKLDYAMKGDT